MGPDLTTSDVAVYPAAADSVDPLSSPPSLPLSSPSGSPVSADHWPQTVRLAFARAIDLQSAQLFTWNLAHTHYENFSVVSALLPRRLRQDFCNIYAFCRIADDLGDEIPDKNMSLRMLARFRQQTTDVYAGKASTLVFTALQSTIARHDIPVQPFLDLIDAFERDQRVDRYDTYQQLRDYCRRSADPVGRLVLYMSGYRDDHRQQLSDCTCTALQLANFWQDVRRDLTDRNRIYLPRETMDQFHVTESQLQSATCDDNYRRCIRFEVDRASALFDQGERLLPLLDESVRSQISLFGQGGRAILQAIRRCDYDTLSSRPVLSRWQKGQLVMRAMAGKLRQLVQHDFAAGPSSPEGE